ncbi:MAG: type IX secretion system sortase PorU [Chitinophagaceae bacterium]|nr:type IX secretion system sortase PorU [Chitinophagaceae bacterium]
MYFDKYGSDPDNRARYLLLMGDASYDYLDRLADNTNLVPAWQNDFSLDVLATYVTDDFYGFLEDDEDIASGTIINDLDIGIGRVPARNEVEAMNYVKKVEAYLSRSSLGPWRTQLGFVADDKDQNAHLMDAEAVAATATTTAPAFDIQKIYLDAYPQQPDAAGALYPQVNQAVDNQLYNGNLIWNFTGHGGSRRLAEEAILDQSMIDAIQNETRLPLFLTATCDFAPYDNPLVPSLGENILLRARTGGIALMTTTRIVFSYSNREMNNNYIRYALERNANGQYRTLGDAVREAKNFTYQNSTDVTNNRKFTLLGDPALRLAFPQHQVAITTVNGLPLAQADTMRASEKILLEGEVRDRTGNLLPAFNGTLYSTVFDKIATVSTLGNDPASPVTTFSSWSHVLFKGKATVSNGRFQLSFKVPRDIRYEPGNGRISLYAENGDVDAMGMEPSLLVGGSGVDIDNDKEGPVIKVYLNDTKFVAGGTTNEKPLLLLELSDSSGINTLGTGIGHDLTVMIDNDPDQVFVLNEYYEADQDSYRKGKLRYQLPELAPGFHSLKIKAWDVVNNSSEAGIDFVVASDEELVLTHVLNYPNPFTTKTTFWFEHNQPGQELEVRLQVFTLTGRVIKVFQRTINTIGNRSSDLEWDGRDEYGDKVARGVYLYRLSVKVPGKKRKEKIEKLVIL